MKLMKGAGQPERLDREEGNSLSAELDRHGLIESINKRYAQ